MVAQTTVAHATIRKKIFGHGRRKTSKRGSDPQKKEDKLFH